MRARIVLMALAASLATLTAQEPQPSFRSAVEVVRLDISAVRGGQPIRGLTALDFTVTDNGVPQQVESVSLAQQPISVLMVLDTSGSMAGEKLNHLADAARAIVASLRPQDHAAIIGFSHEVSVTADLTADRDRLQAAIGSLQAGGATSLRDALFASLQLTPVDDSRPLVLLFTDGDDNTSWLGESEALEAVRRTPVTVDTIDIPETRAAELSSWNTRIGRAAEPGRSFLERVATAGGGRTWSAASSKDLSELFMKAVEEMRARYVVSFTPTGVSRDGWHTVQVKLKGRGEVRTRPGYYVTPLPLRPDGAAH